MQPSLLPSVNNSTEDRDENRNDYSHKSKQTRISIHQGKRFLPYAAIVGTFLFALQSIKFQNIAVHEGPIRNQVASSNSNRTSLTDQHDNGVAIIPSTELPTHEVDVVTIQNQSAFSDSRGSGNHTVTDYHDHNVKAISSTKLQTLEVDKVKIQNQGASNNRTSPIGHDHEHGHDVIATSSPPPYQQQKQQQRRVSFIPYPHKTLGSGDSVQCQWETRHIHSNSTSTVLDITQQNAYKEGVCIPPPLNNAIHIFSSAEAIECLSPKAQQRDIRIFLSGDSYMKQLYIGLADILLSKHIKGGTEIIGSTHRNEVLITAQNVMDRRRKKKDAAFPIIQYECEVECYGREALDKCAKCIKRYSGNKSRSSEDVWIVGIGVHTYLRLERQVDETLQEILRFLDTDEVRDRTIYVSPPAGKTEPVYLKLLPDVAPANIAHPFLDVFQLTKSCKHENCSFDGGHRSRYVNRWKAQMLLNMLCEVH